MLGMQQEQVRMLYSKAVNSTDGYLVAACADEAQTNQMFMDDTLRALFPVFIRALAEGEPDLL